VDREAPSGRFEAPPPRKRVRIGVGAASAPTTARGPPAPAFGRTRTGPYILIEQRAGDGKDQYSDTMIRRSQRRWALRESWRSGRAEGFRKVSPSFVGIRIALSSRRGGGGAGFSCRGGAMHQMVALTRRWGRGGPRSRAGRRDRQGVWGVADGGGAAGGAARRDEAGEAGVVPAPSVNPGDQRR